MIILFFILYSALQFFYLVHKLFSCFASCLEKYVKFRIWKKLKFDYAEVKSHGQICAALSYVYQGLLP